MDNNETFYFLKEDFPKIEKNCMIVEENIYTNSQHAIVEGRKATEKIINEVIDQEGLQKYADFNLINKIDELKNFGIFSKDYHILKAFESIRRIGNKAAHEEVSSEISSALTVHENLFIIAKWFHDKYIDKYEIGEYENPRPESLGTNDKLVEELVSIVKESKDNRDIQNNQDIRDNQDVQDNQDSQVQDFQNNQYSQDNRDVQVSPNNDFSENKDNYSFEETSKLNDSDIKENEEGTDFTTFENPSFNETNNEDNYYISDGKALDSKLINYFPGKVVRKDLTKKIKEGANVPVYVLEYLLGKYATGEDEYQIQKGLENVKNILSDNFVRPDEAEKVKSKIKEYGSYTIIDQVSVKLDVKRDIYYADFSNIGLSNIEIDERFPLKYEKLLGGSIWCMITFEYNPLSIAKLLPIQMPNIDLIEILNARENFTKGEWIDVILKSCGMEPNQLTGRVKMLLLTRLVSLVENNFNLCELGPRSTGKSHIYKEISPNSILVSGGQTTVANLFYNMSTKLVGLVGMWDCVAFDEVAGIKFKDADGIAIMKDYMASYSFSRGKEKKSALASMVFVGNINQSVDYLVASSNLFAPFPPEMANDTAFFDRMHCYIPGWEIPKFRPEHFTNDYGFITDYFAEFMREMRKRSYSNSLDEYFTLGNELNQRDTIAVRKMMSGLIKLIYPNGNYFKEDIRELLILSLEYRRRVKEQLKKIGGLEFFDVNFSFIDNETGTEEWVGVKEHFNGELILEDIISPNQFNKSIDKVAIDTIKESKWKQEREMKKSNDINETKIIENSGKTDLQSKSINQRISYIHSLEDYEQLIYDLEELYQNKEKTARNLIEKCFSPPQITYDRFKDELDKCSILFSNQSKSALSIIDVASRYSQKVADEIQKRLITLNSIIEKIDELNIELAINLSESGDGSYISEVEDLLEDMQKLVDSVKEYD